MVDLDVIRRALAGYEPETLAAEGRRQAAVAMVIREHQTGPEVLFIERARHDRDPWSGHMAFPGGRVDPGDPHARSAAERETLEEVGVRLARAEALGRLDDMQGHHAAAHPALVISAYVYHAADPEPLDPNHEVEQAFWVPLRWLLDPERHVEHPMRLPGRPPFPGIRVGDPDRHVVWGLTYRFLESFFEIVGHPLPDRWQEPPPGRRARPDAEPRGDER